MSEVDYLAVLDQYLGPYVRRRRRVNAIWNLARSLGKSRRTIQRWCEKGLIPGAIRTKGGHWRIPDDTDPKVVMAAANGFSRRSWEDRVGLPTGAHADRIDMALKGLELEDFNNDQVPPNHEGWRIYYGFERYDALASGAEKSTGILLTRRYAGRSTNLVLVLLPAVRALRADGKRVTISALAGKLGISRSQFYRRAAKVKGGVKFIHQILLGIDDA